MIRLTVNYNLALHFDNTYFTTLNNWYIGSRDINESVTQLHYSLSSFVIQLHSNRMLDDMARFVVHKITSSPINSNDGIKFSLDRPLHNLSCLNNFCPTVLRQYFGHGIHINQSSENYVTRYTYGSGSGSLSFGIHI